MKKIIVCLIALLFSASIFANEYPHYGFWSNWSLGVKVDIDKQANNHSWTFGKGTSMGASLFLEKEIDYIWSINLRAGMPGMFTNNDLTSEQRFSRYGIATIGFKFSINNCIMGYNPYRKGSIYLMGNTGLALGHNYLNCDNLTRINAESVNDEHKINLMGEIGIGYSYKVCNSSTLFAELSIIDIAHIPNIFQDNRHGFDVNLSVGYMYGFGITETDKILIEQQSLLTQENFDNNQKIINELEKDKFEQQVVIDKLSAKVNFLEITVDSLYVVINEKDEDIAMLEDKIRQIKEEQLIFYALPFSILYGTDKWKVPSSEMIKLKAIAKVMNDYPKTTYYIDGFCDYTGSDKYNMILSEKRANEVKRILVEKYGIDENRLICEGNGKKISFGDEKFSINRRVSFYRVID